MAKMTDKTFTDRISSIENTLKNKYNMTDEEIEDVKAGIYKGDVSTDLFERIRNIEIARKNFQDASDVTDKIIDIKTDTKDQQSGGGDGTFIGGGASLQDAGGTYDGGYHGAEGGFENTGPTGVDAGTADVQDYADIYANGGRVGLRYGGLLSIL